MNERDFLASAYMMLKNIRKVAVHAGLSVPRIHLLAGCMEGKECKGPGCRVGEWIGRGV